MGTDTSIFTQLRTTNLIQLTSGRIYDLDTGRLYLLSSSMIEMIDNQRDNVKLLLVDDSKGVIAIVKAWRRLQTLCANSEDIQEDENESLEV